MTTLAFESTDYGLEGVARSAALALLALIALVIGWGWFAMIGAAIVAEGQVEVERNRIVLRHPDGGRVAEVFVREGQWVATGTALLRLESGDLQAQLDLTDAELVDLEAQRGRLMAERDGLARMACADGLRADQAAACAAQSLLFAHRLVAQNQLDAQLTRRHEQTMAQIEGLATQAQSLTEEERLLQRQLVDLRELRARGLTTSERLMAADQALARLKGEAASLAAARAQAEGRAAEIELERLRQRMLWSEAASRALDEITPRRNTVKAQAKRLRARIDALEIRAPVDGVVLGLEVQGAGDVLRPAATALALVPTDRPLTVVLAVPAQDAANVHPGQEVRLRLVGQQSAISSDLIGAVTSVSADLWPGESENRPRYRVEVALPPVQGHALRPGQPVEAFIATGERRVIALLISPLMRYFGRAFRSDPA